MKIIDGKKIAEKIKDGLVKEIVKLEPHRPNLAIILVGNRKDSELYVSLKDKEAKKVGIDTHIYRCEENISEQEILDMINYLNNDDLIDAILVQLPLPDKFDTNKIIRAIDPAKDVDRFHPNNLKILMETCNHQHVIPPVLEVVLEILKEINYNVCDQKVCIVANSEVFGNSLAKVLECEKAKVIVTNINDKDLKNKISQSDVLISAVGQPKFITKEMIKDDAIIIDIGISEQDGKICGDVNFEDVSKKAGFITPVPGGVGPLTIAMLFKNTLALYKQRKNKNEK